MEKNLICIVSLLLIAAIPAFAYESLQEVYNNAGSQGIYDKYVELDPAIEYLGDLNISGNISVRLDGNGALIHGRDNAIAIAVWGSHVDISHCVISGGAYGIYFSANSYGTIYCNTISGCVDFGITALYPNANERTEVYDNIVTDCYHGFYCMELNHPDYLGYNTIFNIQAYRYAEFCPD
jgi:parallel beta-helix repeat protein